MKKHIEKFALLGFLAAIVAFSWLKPLDTTAERQVEEGLKRALTSFAVARLLNGVISVAQGTEISVAPGGLGANLTPGQILDPVNDLVEQFSELMLIASVAFGIMKILLGMGSFWIFSAILSGVALVWAAFKLTGRIPPILLTKFLLVLIFVRFSVPVVAVGSDIIFKQFLEDKFNESQMAIENGKKQLAPFASSVGMPQPAEVLSSTVPSQSEAAQSAQEKWWFKTFVEGVGSRIEEVKQSYDPRPYIKNLEARAGELVNHIISLIVVFVLQTIVIPLVLMWALYRSCLALIHSAELKKQLLVAA